MFNKRGISEVVTAILIIAISVVAVVIVGVVIFNIIKANSGKVNSDQFGINLQITNAQINSSEKVDVKVKRNVGGKDLAGIRFVFDEGVKSNFSDQGSLSELEEKTFSFDLSNYNLVSNYLNKVSIRPLFKGSDGEIVVGGVLDEFKFLTQEPLKDDVLAGEDTSECYGQYSDEMCVRKYNVDYYCVESEKKCYHMSGGGSGSPTNPCGDGVCDTSGGETPTSCPTDCFGSGTCNHDGHCGSGENVNNCPDDCSVPGQICKPGLDVNNNYVICNWTDFDYVRSHLNGNYILGQDLDKNSDGYKDNFVPIAWELDDRSKKFTGSFDGNFHSINDLNITTDQGSVGLFYFLGVDSKVYNLNVTGDIQSSSGSAGMIAGASADSLIENVSVFGSVKGIDSVGGIVGSSSSPDSPFGPNRIKSSYSKVDVSGNNNVGGIVGWSYRSFIEKSHFAGNVEGQDGVGGISGSFFAGRIIDSYSEGSINGNFNVGGIASYIAAMGGSSSTISSSYSSGPITVIPGNDVGGIVGNVQQGSSVSYSYSVAKILPCQGNCGGAVGFTHGGNVDYVYFTGNNNGFGTQVPDKNVFYGHSHDVYSQWDFANTWQENPNGFPTLKNVP